MNGKTAVSIFALTLTVLISVPHAVRAGGPVPTVTGASVRGAVRFEGNAPVAKAISMAADPSCAQQHRTPLMTQEVMVDGKGDLQNVIVFVSEGLGERTFEAPTEPVVIDQKGCMYQPHVLAVRANQKLELVNDDPTSHNIHPQPANNREWNKAEPPGSKLEEAFAREEIAIPVKCNVHPWMRAYIGVVSHPFFAVTGDDGTYTIKGLPPGTYTLEVWQEKYGTKDQQVTVGAKESKTQDFTIGS